MTKEQQIKEMAMTPLDILANDINQHCPDLKDNYCGDTHCVACLANALYNAGYRNHTEAEWEKRSFIVFDSEIVGYRCSKCNTTWDTQTPWCPHCGAKMKGCAE